MLARASWIPDISVAAIPKTLRRAQRHGTVSRGVWRGAKLSTIPDPPPPQYEKLVGEKQREALIEVIARYLGQWQASPWQHEASARKILRDYFIHTGHPWPLSDMEAEKIIEVAFRKNGHAVRPSWDEGQPETVRVAGVCLQCGADITPRHGVPTSAFFCEPLPRVASCEDQYNLYRDDIFRAWMTKEGQALGVEAFRDSLGRRTCVGCSTDYRPNFRSQRFCTKLCSLTYDKRPDVACAHCSEIFRPQVRNGKASIFCSKTCAGKAKTKTIDLRCQHCGKGFVSMPGRLFCGNSCYQAHRSAAKAVRAFRCDPA